MSAPLSQKIEVSPFASLQHAAELLQEEARSRGILLRLCGGLACWYRCQSSRELAGVAGRIYKDIDLAAYYRDRMLVVRLLRDVGYDENAESATVPGLRRTIFAAKASSIGGDVFYDKLSFCHTIDLRGRLELDDQSIPLADLLLQKMQIVSLTEYDAVDIQMLLLDHDIADRDGLDKRRIAAVCGADWGFYRTITMNVERVGVIVAKSPYLTRPQRNRVGRQLTTFQKLLENAPRTLAWRIRSLIGERVRWYENVDEH